MHYTVYLWLDTSSVNADITQEVTAASPVGALLQVMLAQGLTQVDLAWVVPEDPALQDLIVPFSWAQAEQEGRS